MDATEILQGYLDRLSDATMRGDFATYADGVALPFSLVTQEKEMSITTKVSLRVGFESYHRMLVSQKATSMTRVVNKAELQNFQWVAGRYTTNIVAGADQLFEPFQSDIFLYSGSGSWQAVWISNDMRNAQWPIHLPLLAHDAYPEPDRMPATALKQG